MPVDRDAQHARVAERWASTPNETFAMAESELDDGRASFQVPDAEELEGTPPAGPPDGRSS